MSGKKKLRRVVALVLILVICASGVFIFLRNKTSTNNKPKPVPTADSVYNEATHSSSKDKKPYEAQLDQLAKDATSNDGKMAYLSAEVRLALGNNDYAQARDAGLNIEQLKPSADSAGNIGDAYEGLNDKPNAIKYFTLAANRSQKTPLNEVSDYSYYMSKVSNLESTK